jgi:hypothetical protein
MLESFCQTPEIQESKAIGEIVAAAVQGKIYVLSGLDNAPGPATHTPTGLNW